MKKYVFLLSAIVLMMLSACNEARMVATNPSSEMAVAEESFVETIDNEIMIENVSIEDNEEINEMSELNLNLEEINKAAIVYFSVTNNTKRVSENINYYFVSNDKLVDLIAIKPKEVYTEEDMSHNNLNSRTRKELNDDKERPEILDINNDFNNYDTIFLGYPIWLGTFPKVIVTFLEKYDLSGKTIIPFCTSGGSGIGSSDKDLQNYTKAYVKPGKSFSSNASEEEVINWVKSIFNVIDN